MIMSISEIKRTAKIEWLNPELLIKASYNPPKRTSAKALVGLKKSIAETGGIPDPLYVVRGGHLGREYLIRGHRRSECVPSGETVMCIVFQAEDDSSAKEFRDFMFAIEGSNQKSITPKEKSIILTLDGPAMDAKTDKNFKFVENFFTRGEIKGISNALGRSPGDAIRSRCRTFFSKLYDCTLQEADEEFKKDTVKPLVRAFILWVFIENMQNNLAKMFPYMTQDGARVLLDNDILQGHEERVKSSFPNGIENGQSEESKSPKARKTSKKSAELVIPPYTEEQSKP
jgi:hypothetical protein